MPYTVTLSELYLDPLAKRWKHLSESDLLIPDWVVVVPLNTCTSLKKDCVYNVIVKMKLTDKPAKETCTYGLTRSFC